MNEEKTIHLTKKEFEDVKLSKYNEGYEEGYDNGYSDGLSDHEE